MKRTNICRIVITLFKNCLLVVYLVFVLFVFLFFAAVLQPKQQATTRLHLASSKTHSIRVVDDDSRKKRALVHCKRM